MSISLIPFINDLAGESHIKDRIRTVILYGPIVIPFRIKCFSSSTNGFK